MNAVGGIGISKYGTSLDLRFERNLTNLNKTIDTNNANFNDLFLIRICLSFTLPHKNANTFLSTNQNSGKWETTAFT